MNEAPVVGDIPDQTIAEGEAFTTINLDDYVSDVDNTDAEMTWTYTGNSELSVTIVDRVATIGIPNSGWNGSETITFTATDPGLLSDSDDATFTVTPVNDPPVAVDDSATTDEDKPVGINVLTDDSDPDDDTLTISDYDTSSTGGGTVNCISTGVCTYSPPADFNGLDTFTYTASDGNGGADTDTATVTVTVIAAAPPENLIYLPLIWKA